MVHRKKPWEIIKKIKMLASVEGSCWGQLPLWQPHTLNKPFIAKCFCKKFICLVLYQFQSETHKLLKSKQVKRLLQKNTTIHSFPFFFFFLLCKIKSIDYEQVTFWKWVQFQGWKGCTPRAYVRRQIEGCFNEHRLFLRDWGEGKDARRKTRL